MARTLYSNLGTTSALGAVAYDHELDAALDGSAGSGSLAISGMVKNSSQTVIFWDDATAHWSSTWPNADTFSYSIDVTASTNISSSCTIGVYRLSSGGGTLVSSATDTIDLSSATTVTGSFSTATLSAGAATDVLGCYLLINQSGSHSEGSITIGDASTNISSTDLSATEPPASTTQIKVYNGASWDTGVLKYYNGSSWETKPLKQYNGSSWDFIDGNQ